MIALLFLLGVTTVRIDAYASPTRDPIRDTSSSHPIGEDHAAPGFAPLGPALRANARTHLPLSPSLSLTASLEARLGLLNSLSPPVSLPRAQATSRATAHIPEAFLHFETPSDSVSLSAGRHPLPAWSPALRGNLLLNPTHVPPMDAVSATFRTPRRTFTAEAFVARLEDPRGHPLLAGQRMTFTPPLATLLSPNLPGLSLSAQRALVCCEAGSGVRAADIPTILLAERENIPGDRLDFDQLASATATLSLPRPLVRATHTDARVWIEYGGTDFYGFDDVRRNGGFPRRTPGLIGPGTVFGGAISYRNLTVRGEGAKIDVKRLNFYAARRYPDGYTWQERPIGHPAGGRTRSAFLETEFTVAPGATIGLFASEERYNLHTPDRARRSRLGLQLAVPAPARPLRTTLRIQTVDESAPTQTRYAEALLTLELGPFR